MRFPRLVSFGLALLLLSAPLPAQQSPPPQRDPQAITVLSQTVNAAGGLTAVSAIQDYTATGTVTYLWAGQPVQGTVTLRQKGADEFRLDANLQSGIRSWAVSYGAGSVKETDGSAHPVGFANALKLGALTFPLAEIYTDLQDSSTTLIYMGSTQIAGRTVQQIHAQRNFSPQSDPDGSLSKLRARDLFIDSSNLQLILIRDILYPPQSFTANYQHEISFSDYRTVNGLLVPFTISEKIAGQQTWIIQLSQTSFNSGLSDSDFQI